MRYQYPAPSPLAHYWEEEISGVWGIWLHFPKKAGGFFGYLFGEVIFANLFLVFELVFNLRIAIALRQGIAVAVSRIRFSSAAKRLLDLSGAVIGIMITSPLWLAVALAIKLDSRGPVFFTQERVGQNRRRQQRRSLTLLGADRRALTERRRKAGFGRTFIILKFRSMKIDAEKETGPIWATKRDPRVTRVGRILRATRLDELPQLVNVLMGDMSLVGPRPERPYFVTDLGDRIENYISRFDAKPGITGLAQVEHKYDECVEDVSKKIAYDLRYIRNWSVLQDLKIIMKTVVVVFSARGM